MHRPPSNALSAPMVQHLQAQIHDALAAPDILAIVLASDLGHFSAGSDTADLTAPKRNSKQAQATLCALIAGADKPVVAAVRGGCLGAGLELALAAGGRLAAPDAQFAFPDINLGLMPAAGATLRLPYLIGPEAALDMMLEATVLSAKRALDLGLVDRIESGDLLAAACRAAQDLRAAPPPMHDSAALARATQLAVSKARIHYAGRRLQAYAKIIDCVEAGLIFPPDQLVALENRCYDDLAFSSDTIGICAALVAGHRLRAAAFPAPFPAPLPATPLVQINIAGAGGAVARLAARAMMAGVTVHLADPSEVGRNQTLAQITALLVAELAEGRLTLSERNAAWSRLHAVPGVQGFDGGAIFLGAGADVAGGIHLTETPALPKPGAGQFTLTAQGSAHYAIDPAAPPRVAATLAGLFARLNLRTYDLAQGGAVESAIKQVLADCIRLLQSQGFPRETLIAALAASGLASDPTRVLPPAPAQSPQILAAIHLAVVNLGARLLREGRVPRAFAFDAVAVQGGLFARWLGGPMYWADQRGAMVLRADLRKRMDQAPDLFTPDPLWDRLIAKGLRLSDLD